MFHLHTDDHHLCSDHMLMNVVFSSCTFYLLCSLHAQMIVLFCFKVQCPDLQQKMKSNGSLQNHPSNENCTKHMNSEMEAVD